MSESLLIGIDFDNTLICYDALFHELAVAEGLIPADTPARKKEVRDAVRALPGGEARWQSLQARVYGPEIDGAIPAPGALAALRDCQGRGAGLCIVSHKSEFAAAAPKGPSLRVCARKWLDRHLFGGRGGLDPAKIPVFFEATRAEKIARIKLLGCAAFIDDLEEIFADPSFPQGVIKILYGTHRPTGAGIIACPNWQEVGRVLSRVS